MRVLRVHKITTELVHKCLLEVISDLPFNPNLNLFEAGHLDSLNLLNVVMTLEKTFEVEFKPKDLTGEKIKSIESITLVINNM